MFGRPSVTLMLRLHHHSQCMLLCRGLSNIVMVTDIGLILYNTTVLRLKEPSYLLYACSRLDLSIEVLSIDPQLLSGYSVAAKLYHDSPDLTEAQPVLETTLDLTGQGPSTSDRMAGSKADWHRGTAQVSHPSWCTV
jgi:hypothetical protein